MSLFVTVGSTSFDALVNSVCSQEVLQILASNGFRRVVLQIGRGEVIPNEKIETQPPVKVEWFRYKDSIHDDIRSATLVVGHAGAGTVLETLLQRKPLITVLNESLMDGHQSELANQMVEDGMLLSCTCDTLKDTLRDYFASPKKLATYESEQGMFPAFLEDFMGIR